MPLEKPARSRPSDPAFDLLESALHDGAVILEAYGRFATTVIGALLFPYAAARPVMSAPKQSDTEPPPQSHHLRIVTVVIAMMIGAVLGRRLSRRRWAPRQT
jgi:hypothetical protein